MLIATFSDRTQKLWSLRSVDSSSNETKKKIKSLHASCSNAARATGLIYLRESPSLCPSRHRTFLLCVSRLQLAFARYTLQPSSCIHRSLSSFYTIDSSLTHYLASTKQGLRRLRFSESNSNFDTAERKRSEPAKPSTRLQICTRLTRTSPRCFRLPSVTAQALDSKRTSIMFSVVLIVEKSPLTWWRNFPAETWCARAAVSW